MVCHKSIFFGLFFLCCDTHKQHKAKFCSGLTSVIYKKKITYWLTFSSRKKPFNYITHVFECAMEMNLKHCYTESRVNDLHANHKYD